MTGFGLFLFLIAILYLIDKNQGWAKFWRGIRALAAVAFIALILLYAHSYWSDRGSAARQATVSKTLTFDAHESAQDDPYAQIAKPIGKVPQIDFTQPPPSLNTVTISCMDKVTGKLVKCEPFSCPKNMTCITWDPGGSGRLVTTPY